MSVDTFPHIKAGYFYSLTWEQMKDYVGKEVAVYRLRDGTESANLMMLQFVNADALQFKAPLGSAFMCKEDFEHTHRHPHGKYNLCVHEADLPPLTFKYRVLKFDEIDESLEGKKVCWLDADTGKLLRYTIEGWRTCVKIEKLGESITRVTREGSNKNCDILRHDQDSNTGRVRLAVVIEEEIVQPKNNDGRATCFSCNAPTRVWMGLNYKVVHHICTKCGR